MTSLAITIDDEKVRAMLERLQDRLQATRPLMEVIGDTILASVERNFAAEGRPTPWTPSARAEEQGGQTLTDTGRLRRSITAEAGMGWVAIGTNVAYGRIHQLGGVIRPKKAKALKAPYGLRQSVTMPARPYLMIQDEDWTEIHEAISDFLTEDL